LRDAGLRALSGTRRSFWTFELGHRAISGNGLALVPDLRHKFQTADHHSVHIVGAHVTDPETCSLLLVIPVLSVFGKIGFLVDIFANVF